MGLILSLSVPDLFLEVLICGYTFTNLDACMIMLAKTALTHIESFA